MKARPISEYHEDMGPVLWWKFPIDEPPYVGGPGDLGHTVEVTVRAYGVDKIMLCQVGGWPNYHTHWTQLPSLPDSIAPPASEQSTICVRCRDGEKPCVRGNPNQCEWPRAKK